MNTINTEIKNIRDHLANVMLVALALLSPMAVLSSLYRATIIGWHPAMTFQIICFCFVIITTIYRKRISLPHKTIFMNIIFISVGSSGIFQFGILSQAALLFIISPVLTMVLLGKRIATAVFFISICILAGIGWNIVSNGAAPSFDVAGYLTTAPPWATLVFTIILATGILLYSFDVYTGFLVDALLQRKEALKQLALERDGLERRVEERTSHLKALEQELRRTNNELEQFAYVASHDLRQPLRMVSSYLGMIEKQLDTQLSNDTKIYFGYAIDGAKKMDRLIKDLLEYSRTGKSGETDTVSLGGALSDALTNLTISIRESGAEISLADTFPTIRGDLMELTRLFQNLIGNSLKYRSPDRLPKVDIGWGRQQNGYLVWVKDNGIGIPSDQHERAFMIFQRLVPKGAYEGSGIGLAICKKLVERHGGTIWIESVVDDGCTFFFTLPDELAPTHILLC